MGQCAQRDRQSPISIDTLLKTPPSDEFSFWYNPIKDEALKLQANGGLLSVDMTAKARGGVAFKNKWYPLSRIDFHAKAEHLLKGKRYPLEIQLVHRAVDDPMSSLIISVLVWSEVDPPAPTPRPNAKPKPFKVPDKKEIDFNPNIQNFVTVEPPSEEGKSVTLELKDGLDLSTLVANPKVNGSDVYMSYGGSLTSPPCIGNTQWFVRRLSAIASNSQVKAISDAIFKLTFNSGNYRSVMPMNGRILQVYRAVKKIKMRVNEDTSLNWGSNPRTDGEFEAQALAKHADLTAQRSNQYIEDFARRMGNAQQAFADSLSHTTSPIPFEATPEGKAAAYAAQVFKVRQAIMGAVGSVGQAVDASIAWQSHQIKGETIAWESYNAHQAAVAANAVAIDQANAALAAQMAAAAAAAGVGAPAPGPAMGGAPAMAMPFAPAR